VRAAATHHATPTWRPALDALGLGRDKAVAVWLMTQLRPGARTVHSAPHEYSGLIMRGPLRDLVAIEHRPDRVLVHLGGLLRAMERDA
jgi:hypothetical protein